ncbi:recE [Rhodococcus sp. WB9]|uniref:PD-(D/E)XK nuclease-like domain-containing protein n=1 Tax=Rhodococcus sp. WB9 TaxID=2594007 RepID=UPI001186729D|nr:PD-(D/E)XK nuclease-like domain-containing protein [Rhodococcus sp. WB9]QDQ93731.1 recE [Rhodococcus sp. WB9]
MSDLLAPDQIGVFADIPDYIYHGDKLSLSSSGARALLPPSTPAQFRYAQDNPRESTKAFDLGHAAHTLVLGAGEEIVEVEAKDWKTKAAQAERDAIYAEGKTPLLTKEVEQVRAMARAIRRNRHAAALLESGTPELSMYWDDPDTGARLRCRPDWMPNLTVNGRTVIVDYKSSTSANPDKFAKSAADFGYAQQAPFYIDGLIELGIADDPIFLFVVQDKNPPYLVSVIELHSDDIEVGRQLNRKAVDLFAACMETGLWPDYSDDVHLVSLPAWWRRQHENQLPW